MEKCGLWKEDPSKRNKDFTWEIFNKILSRELTFE